MMIRIGLFLIVGLVGIAGYIRLAPARIEDWHRPPLAYVVGNVQRTGGFQASRRITAPADAVLQAVAERALITPRTHLFAGSVENGILTFVTRSALWGFPDYTTVSVQGDILVISGHLRFGKSDLGVNESRILGWLESLAPLTVPL